MTGPIGQPLRAGASVIDIMGAMFGIIAAQAALRERDATGKGQRVSSALFENAAFLMSTHMVGMTATGLEARPMPARRGAWAIYEVFNTAGGGQLFIGVTSDQQWTRFVEEFGLQELAGDPRLATNVMRLAERSWLKPALQEVLSAIPQDEIVHRCERANVSWAPVGQPGDLFTDEHLLATGGLVDVFISYLRAPSGPLKLDVTCQAAGPGSPREARPTASLLTSTRPRAKTSAAPHRKQGRPALLRCL